MIQSSTEKRKKFILSFLILFSFFLIGLVSAAPPLQVSDKTVGLEVRTASPENMELNKAFDFHVHVYNSSTGMPVHSGITCYMHAYKLNGKHLYEGFDATSSHDFDYSFDLPANNFTEIGEHPYVVQCNNSVEGGFIASSFFVISTNESASENIQYFFYIILAITAGLLIIGFIKLDAPMTLLGSFGLTFIGIYILFNGIVGIRNTTTTYALGIIVLAAAGYIAIRSAMELISD